MTKHRHDHAGRLGVRTLALPLAFLISVACEDPPTETTVAQAAAAPDQLVAQADASGVTAQGTIALPINQSTSTAAPNPAFGIKQTGTGPDAVFSITNSTSSSHALTASTTGKGRAGSFTITNPASSASAIFAQTNSSGMALNAVSNGTGSAGKFVLNKSGSSASALLVNTNGAGPAINSVTTGSGPAARFQVNNNSASFDAHNGLEILTNAATANSAAISIDAASGAGASSQTYSTDGVDVSLDDQNNAGTAFSGITEGSSGYAARLLAPNGATGLQIQTKAGAVGLSVIGGTKNAVVGTATGARALYTEESTEVWFTDYGFGRLVNGRARILLDPTFAQTVDLDQPYHVFVEPYSDAELYVRNRTPLGFEVDVHDGDPNAEFSYRVVARRAGYGNKRLERTPWADGAVSY